MYIRILSDLHTEFANYDVEKLPEDQDTTLILAGDCGLFKHIVYAEWMQNLCKNFHKIILVAGNHEFYSGKMYTEQEKFEKRVDCENLHLLQNDSVVIDDVLFLGGTLWTSFRSGNPLVMLHAENGMNDYKKIRLAKNGYRRIRPLDILLEHNKTRDFLFDTLRAERDKYEKIVVVTHHAPSTQSIPACWKGDPLNEMFVNDYDYQMAGIGPDLWFHGHTHFSLDYMMNDTRVICNPKGYPVSPTLNENETFNPTLRLEV